MTSRFWYLFSKKISGEASPEELQELDVLVKENPEWAYSAGQLQKIWNNEKKTDVYYSELAFEDHLNKLSQKGIDLTGFDSAFVNGKTYPPDTSKKTIWMQATALLVILIAIGLTWKMNSENNANPVKKNSYSELQTKAGSRIRLLLPDSSVVWLNAGSRLTYNEQFGVTNRNTTLTGEAFFDVRKSSIPFIIHSGGIQIKVLGTAFNVRSYPNEKTETSLIRGTVEVTLEKRPGEKYLLKPNEKLVVSNTQNETHARQVKSEPIVVLQPLLLSKDSTYLETSWVDNKLVFQDESFSELAVKMERWYGVQIRIDDEKIARQRLSGSFTTETIQEAMEALKLSTSFHYSLKSNVITITK